MARRLHAVFEIEQSLVKIKREKKVKLPVLASSFFFFVHAFSLFHNKMIDWASPASLSPKKSFCSQQFVSFFKNLHQSFFLSLSLRNIYTYHSLKFDVSVLWLLVWCTAEAAGDMELLLWFSVDGDTMVGGVDDS